MRDIRGTGGVMSALTGPGTAAIAERVRAYQDVFLTPGRAAATRAAQDDLRREFGAEAGDLKRLLRVRMPNLALPDAAQGLTYDGHPEVFARIVRRAMQDADVPGALSFRWRPQRVASGWNEQSGESPDISGFAIVTQTEYEMEWVDEAMAERLESRNRTEAFVTYLARHRLDVSQIAEGLRGEAPMIEEAEGRDLDRSVIEYFLDNGYDYDTLIAIAGFDPPTDARGPDR